jgi:hypothetical protein
MSKEDVLKVQVRELASSRLNSTDHSSCSCCHFLSRAALLVFAALPGFRSAVPVTVFVPEFADSGAASEHPLRWVREEGQEDPPQDRR